MGKKPAIRFEDYTEDWEQRKYAEVIELLSGQDFNPEEYNEDGIGIPYLTGASCIENGYTTAVRWTENPRCIVEKGDTVLVCKGSGYGGIATVNQEKAHIARQFMALKVKKYELDNKFNYYLLNSVVENIKADARGLIAGIARDAVLKQEIVDPYLNEQRKIGEYFSNLDNLITLHQSNYEKMVSTKKSMLNKLFPQDETKVPAIRFEGFEGDWKKKPLSAIVVPYSDPVEVPHNGYERLGIRSYGKGVFHEYVEAGKEITTAQLHRVAAHNFIVNITFAWEHAVAVTSDEDAGKLVSHRFPQFSMADGIYDQFLKYLILDARFRHHLLLSSPGGAGRNRVLKIPEMLEYEMRIPDIEEQKQIAGYLNSLDDLIELYRIRIEKLKNIKAACLQGMFV